MAENQNELDEKAIKRTIALLYLYADINADVQRIIEMVQGNADYFNSRPGTSCVKTAADKLESLIAQSKGK